MDWQSTISLIVMPIFTIIAIILTLITLKQINVRKPVWGYETDPEFPDQIEKNSYVTYFVFINHGRQTISGNLPPGTDIIKEISVEFVGANIVGEPILKAKSKEAIDFSATKITIGGNDAIRLNFKYLNYNDGAMIKVLHTRCDNIICCGEIRGSTITLKKKFTRAARFMAGLDLFLCLTLMPVGWWAFIRSLSSPIIQSALETGAVFFFPFMLIISGLWIIAAWYDVMNSLTFPRWSMI